MEPLKFPREFLPNEQFKLIDGVDRLYCISNYGRVYSRWCKGKKGSFVDRIWRQLKPQKVKGGYYTVTLRTLSLTKFIRTIHTLVLEIFVSSRPKEYDIHCCHIDGNPANNYVGNLKWATRSENAYDSIKHGTFHHPDNTGELNGQSKLNAEIVKEIRFKAFLGKYHKDLAKEYGVTRGCISAVVNYTNWRHV